MKDSIVKNHYTGIDGLRAIAAFGIVIMHILKNGNYNITGFIVNNIIVQLGEFVFLFMIISGFSMCCGYYDKIRENKINIEDFYKKRYQKILPFFSLLCFIDFIVSPSLNALYEMFADITLLFGLLPNANITVIGVGWFLGLVFVFYLLFPFFVFILSDKKRLLIFSVVAVLYNLICEVYFMDHVHIVENFDRRSNIMYCLIYFLVGGIIFLYKDQISKFTGKHRIISFIVVVIAASLYFGLSSNLITRLFFFSSLLLYAIGEGKHHILSSKIAVFVSGISLEIYLCHMLFFRIVEKLHFAHLFKNDIISYVITITLVLFFAIVFSVSIKKLMQIGMKYYIKKIKSK